MGIRINEELNKLPAWRDKVCIHCGRKYPDTIINIEGMIHHHGQPVCVDTKSCNRAKKKLK